MVKRIASITKTNSSEHDDMLYLYEEAIFERAQEAAVSASAGTYTKILIKHEL